MSIAFWCLGRDIFSSLHPQLCYSVTLIVTTPLVVLLLLLLNFFFDQLLLKEKAQYANSTAVKTGTNMETWMRNSRGCNEVYRHLDLSFLILLDFLFLLDLLLFLIHPHRTKCAQSRISYMCPLPWNPILTTETSNMLRTWPSPVSSSLQCSTHLVPEKTKPASAQHSFAYKSHNYLHTNGLTDQHFFDHNPIQVG